MSLLGEIKRRKVFQVAAVYAVALHPELAVTVGIACLAVGGQALRAARVRPAEVLKCE